METGAAKVIPDTELLSSEAFWAVHHNFVTSMLLVAGLSRSVLGMLIKSSNETDTPRILDL